MIKKVHTIRDEYEFGDTNENEVNEPSNAILKDFDDCLMDDVGHVVTNNDNNIVYNDQPYCYSNNIFCYNKVFLIIIKIFYCNKIFVAIVYCHRFYRNCGQQIFFLLQ